LVHYGSFWLIPCFIQPKK